MVPIHYHPGVEDHVGSMLFARGNQTKNIIGKELKSSKQQDARAHGPRVFGITVLHNCSSSEIRISFLNKGQLLRVGTLARLEGNVRLMGLLDDLQDNRRPQLKDRHCLQSRLGENTLMGSSRLLSLFIPLPPCTHSLKLQESHASCQLAR